MGKNNVFFYIQAWNAILVEPKNKFKVHNKVVFIMQPCITEEFTNSSTQGGARVEL